MEQTNLTITKGQTFEHVFQYVERKKGQDFGIDITNFDIRWEVLDLRTDPITVLLAEDTEYDVSRSQKRNGYIVIDMTASQTESLPDDINNVPYMLYIEDTINDERYLLQVGTITIQGWTRYGN